ncbi:MAG: hypothetical protein COB77_01535 [Gammaproteobacteria bacterium]|nr:MAG: hypothetical protein COB77_01535 [Gammaproteobacteria bacterium]
MTNDDKKTNDIDALRANINNEAAQINWKELERLFAGGWLIYVSSDKNLLDVAIAFTLDNKAEVSQWLTSGEVTKVSVEQAKQWHEQNTVFWSTVVKPWVLIQPLKDSNEDTEQNKSIH